MQFAVIDSSTDIQEDKVAKIAVTKNRIPTKVPAFPIALLSTILIGWVVTPDYVISEMERSGDKFRRKKLYRVMIRFVAPVMMFILFLQSTGILS